MVGQIQMTITDFARKWVKDSGGKREVAKLMKARDYAPVPVDGPEISPSVGIHAVGADRGGVALLDSGGHVHFVQWSEVES